MFELPKEYINKYLHNWKKEYSSQLFTKVDTTKVGYDNIIKNHLNPIWDLLFERIGENYKSRLFFAGGCFQSLSLNETVNDYDLFAYDQHTAFSFQKILLDKFKKSILLSKKSLYFYLDDYKINFVTFNYGTPHYIINKFDFCHTMNYYTGNGEIHLSPNLGSKNLVFNEDCSNSIGSIYRIPKFLSRGYSIKIDEYTKILASATQHTKSIHKEFTTNIKVDQSWFNSISSFYQDNHI